MHIELYDTFLKDEIFKFESSEEIIKVSLIVIKESSSC